MHDSAGEQSHDSGQANTGDMGKENLCKRKVLLSDLQLFFISTVCHPSLNKIPVLFLLIHLCKYLTSLKPAQLQNSCQTSKSTSFLLHKHWICVPKGPFRTSHAAWYDLLLIIYKAECLQAAGDLSVGKSSSPCHQREARTHTLRAQHQRILPSGHPALQGAHPDLQSKQQK